MTLFWRTNAMLIRRCLLPLVLCSLLGFVVPRSLPAQGPAVIASYTTEGWGQVLDFIPRISRHTTNAGDRLLLVQRGFAFDASESDSWLAMALTDAQLAEGFALPATLPGATFTQRGTLQALPDGRLARLYPTPRGSGTDFRIEVIAPGDLAAVAGGGALSAASWARTMFLAEGTLSSHARILGDGGFLVVEQTSSQQTVNLYRLSAEGAFVWGAVVPLTGATRSVEAHLRHGRVEVGISMTGNGPSTYLYAEFNDATGLADTARAVTGFEGLRRPRTTFLPDGGVVLTASRDDQGFQVVRLDAGGNVVWAQQYLDAEIALNGSWLHGEDTLVVMAKEFLEPTGSRMRVIDFRLSDGQWLRERTYARQQEIDLEPLGLVDGHLYFGGEAHDGLFDNITALTGRIDLDDPDAIRGLDAYRINAGELQVQPLAIAADDETVAVTAANTFAGTLRVEEFALDYHDAGNCSTLLTPVTMTVSETDGSAQPFVATAQPYGGITPKGLTVNTTAVAVGSLTNLMPTVHCRWQRETGLGEPFPDAEPLAAVDGWWQTWYGSLAPVVDSTVFFSGRHGFQAYSPGSMFTGAYLFDFARGIWWFTGHGIYPAVYVFWNDTGWLWFDVTTTHPERAFIRLDGSDERIPESALGDG